MREYPEILLDRYERGHRQRILVHFAAATFVIDSHHIPISRTVLVALDSAVGAALRYNATPEIRSRFDLDLGGMRQAFCGVRQD